MMNAVEMEEVTKTFGPCVAVDQLSLAVPSGSVYGFIGPNGSGKTTTLRMIMNIFYPDHGAVRVLGRTASGAATDRIGYLPEERGLYRGMKVKEALMFYGNLKGGRDVGGEVRRWLRHFEIEDWAGKKLEALSKGMFQKVQFLATIVARPELLVLDEPFSGLDPVNADVIKQAVVELRREGTTVVLSTHDMNTAETMCDRILMIFQGRKVLDGTLASIQEAYAQDTVRLRTDAGMNALENLPGVERVRDLGQVQELRVSPQADTQELLRVVLSRTRVRGFEIMKPSLHDIFVRIAGPEARQ